MKTLAGALLLTAVSSALAEAPTDVREPCENFIETRQALFGDLHVHTKYSFDSYISSQRNDPWDAYRYAKGETITLPGADGTPTIKATIGRPLDFTAVTDHAEFLGPINICTEDRRKLGYWWPHCMLTRSNNLWLQLISASFWTDLGGQQENLPSPSFACSLSDCEQGAAEYWQNIQQAAEDHYDRSGECAFTTFVGYEYTEAFDQNNMHRNVIFRNHVVTEKPVSVYDTGKGSFPELWQQLRTECLDKDNGCDVMSIPHNPNLAGGLMFRDPQSQIELDNRLLLEPLVELIQHKGASECRFDRLLGQGLNTNDELCDFEQIGSDNLNMLGSVEGKVRTEKAKAVALEKFAERNMVRNALKAGLELEKSKGTNPFVMGFIGSTDTHSAAPGSAEEDNYVGHLGRRDAEYRNVQDHFFSNPGGHAVVWAQENTRDAIFDAIRRKETYATSGTRPIVRFFAGEYPEDLCESPNLLNTAYAKGVPMGGELKAISQSGPSFLVSAQKDAGTPTAYGTDLQRLQIIKGWIDESGTTHEKVFNIAGTANNSAGVDPNNCNRIGSGHARLCAVWQDPEYDASQSAFYYVRVLENPSCRWSTLQCQAAGVNPFSKNCAAQAETADQRAHERGATNDVYAKCCLDEKTQPFYSPVIQERAWTSPIWVKP